jgi:hypothetical protein
LLQLLGFLPILCHLTGIALAIGVVVMTDCNGGNAYRTISENRKNWTTIIINNEKLFKIYSKKARSIVSEERMKLIEIHQN